MLRQNWRLRERLRLVGGPVEDTESTDSALDELERIAARETVAARCLLKSEY